MATADIDPGVSVEEFASAVEPCEQLWAGEPEAQPTLVRVRGAAQAPDVRAHRELTIPDREMEQP